MQSGSKFWALGIFTYNDLKVKLQENRRRQVKVLPSLAWPGPEGIYETGNPTCRWSKRALFSPFYVKYFFHIN